MDKQQQQQQQPTPAQFDDKRRAFTRLQDMALATQRMRRALGFVWLEGGVGHVDGGIPADEADEVRVYAHQSGQIVAQIIAPKEGLYVPTSPGSVSRLVAHHRHISNAVYMAEFVWDEAMLAERMT